MSYACIYICSISKRKHKIEQRIASIPLYIDVKRCTVFDHMQNSQIILQSICNAFHSSYHKQALSIFQMCLSNAANP